MANEDYPVYADITGPIVMIGFGSIGRGTLPLIERHFTFDKSRLTVVDPNERHRAQVDAHGYRFVKEAVTRENYEALLTPLLTNGEGQGFCVNLSVDTSSLDLMKLCRKLGVLYIDTVVEPWLGFYYDEELRNEERTNYRLRDAVQREKLANPGGTTAVSCCGANPGMVSWFVKQALLDIARDTGIETPEPAAGDRAAWAALMRQVGVKGIHVAERDTQYAPTQKPIGVFRNTWSVDGFLSEGMQPAELGWGTHEKWLPATARKHSRGSRAAIFLEQPGANTRVRTWCPTPGPQFGYLVTHNEAISLADYFTVRSGSGEVQFRPTCHYAYHPCNDAVLSLNELFGAAGKFQPVHELMTEEVLVEGVDELGVLLFGHEKNAYWYGSRLSLAEARQLAPFQNATALQVTSAVLTGMVWALENPERGIVETEEMDFHRCLEIQKPYLGPVEGIFTDWTPLTDRPGLFDEDLDMDDPWQFKNILVR
ncbi:homospermidine synthase [Mangrovibrevibacter kandeliae]|uniref:homospermidine synthase n=1 Tax=Mangrovibrevibacter kandeliae TaxID=2968473 RepID=UPI00211821B5|nr:homospermidine synthase [Aurantimonas sp. CSK15Z-1]MCQ8783267.1 homospermidine synthase [Aurantimonas sp. CSK15Z-1]